MRRRLRRRRGHAEDESPLRHSNQAPRQRGESSVLALQRAVGNRAVTGLIHRQRADPASSPETLSNVAAALRIPRADNGSLASASSRMLEQSGGSPPALSLVPEARVTSKVKIEDAVIEVQHSARDIDLAPRLAMLTQVLKMVTDAGFKVPDNMKVRLPDWGKEIQASSPCEVGDAKKPAAFVPPDVVHLSSAVTGPAIDSLFGSADRSHPKPPDPNAAEALLHQIGHFFHAANGGSLFTSPPPFSGEMKLAAAMVSDFARTNPREFVAEVFAGLVLGKSFAAEVLLAYADLGGPLNSNIQGSIEKARKAAEMKAKAAAAGAADGTNTGGPGSSS